MKEYEVILIRYGYTNLEHGWRFVKDDIEHFVTLFYSTKEVQVWSTYEGTEEKVYDTSIIQATPADLSELIRILVINN